MQLVGWGIVLVATMGSWGVGSASAPTPPIVVVSHSEVAATDASGGAHSFKLSVANNADVPAVLKVLSSDPACVASDVQFAPQTSTEATFTLPAACEIPEDGLALKITAAVGADAEFTAFALTLTTEVEPDPNWWALLTYALAAPAALFVAHKASRKASLATPPGPIKWGTKLPGISKDWSLDDSIATNAAFAVVLFTGLFASSDVVEALFGEQGNAVVSIATVAAAVTAGLVGLGPVVLIIAQGYMDDDQLTAGAVIVASAFVLAGNGGLVAVMYEVLIATDLLPDIVIQVLATFAGVLLVAYGYYSVRRALRAGLKTGADQDFKVSALP